MYINFECLRIFINRKQNKPNKFELNIEFQNEIFNLFSKNVQKIFLDNKQYYSTLCNNLEILPYIINIKTSKEIKSILNNKLNYYTNKTNIIPIISNSHIDNCSICLTFYQLDDIIYLTKCNHEFHIYCLTLWLKDNNVCPLCRTILL